MNVQDLPQDKLERGIIGFIMRAWCPDGRTMLRAVAMLPGPIEVHEIKDMIESWDHACSARQIDEWKAELKRRSALRVAENGSGDV